MIKTRKYVGIIILVFGTALVGTIFGNYFIDLSIADIPNIPQIKMIYEAQLTMAKIICFLAGGCLGLVSLVVALFTVNRYINDNLSPMGILKAIGYTNVKISAMFLNVGIYVYGGSLLGYVGGMVIAQFIYTAMSENTGYILELSFHITVPFILTIVLPILFSLISFAFSYFQLRKPALNMIRQEVHTKMNVKKLHKFRFKNNMSYLKELKKITLSNHKIVLFFIGFASFGFSSQIQLPLTMINSTMSDSAMTVVLTVICLPIGILLGSVTLLIAGEFIINSNKQYIAVMKAFGYSDKECNYALLDSYRLPAYIGFIIGTIYQYSLIKLFLYLFADVYEVNIPFDLRIFASVFIVFLFGYELVMYGYKRKLAKISLKQIME